MTLVDAANGSSPTDLQLEQSAFGGVGGNANGGLAGISGYAATSRLTKTAASNSLTTFVGASGGHGGSKSASSGTSGVGGDATAETVLTSNVGQLKPRTGAVASGRIGNGRRKRRPRRPIQLHGFGFHNWQQSSRGSPFQQHGWRGRKCRHGKRDRGAGGNATSSSTGVVTGESSVNVVSTAAGGIGGGSKYFVGGANPRAAPAAAEAHGERNRTVNSQLFRVTSTANGGNGGYGGNAGASSNGKSGNGGAATATTQSNNSGTGLTEAYATATGGAGGLASGVGFFAGLGAMLRPLRAEHQPRGNGCHRDGHRWRFARLSR